MQASSARPFLLAACLLSAAPEALAQASSIPSAGGYWGWHLGYGTGHTDWSSTGQGGLTGAGTTALSEPFDAFKGTGNYLVGLQAGHNWFGPGGILYGVEADVSIPNQIRGTGATTTNGGAFGFAVTSTGSIRGRLGYTWNDWLFYGTGGMAWATTTANRTHSSGNAGNATAGTVEDTSSRLRLGLVGGVGFEVPLDNRWGLNAEYLHAGYGRNVLSFPASGDRLQSDLTTQTLRFGLNYHYDTPGAESSSKSPTLAFEQWSVHGQSTLTYQYVAPFRAPYQGTNSLQPNQARETFDATFYVGRRLWSGAELWINPEIDQGFGLNAVTGIASFPSAEAYKVGAVEPYARLPRLFIRQTIGLGGETEEVAPGINQLGGRQSKDRVVVTVGKLSVPDIFDTNKYAHDPRSDFLNWAIVDTASFDYAADAWAFTYGGAVEWYQGPWTLRAGFFDLPIVPNSTDLDPTFKQHQWLAEIERRYTFMSQPGKVAVTGFLSQGRMARFQDAVNVAAQTSSVPDLATSRRFQSRTGISFNLEQDLAKGVGVFARAGISDGRTEPFAFTDSDQTIAAGIVVSGQHWGRPDDSWGGAGLLNAISGPHRAYLNAGGLTALLGDGKLPNYAPEHVLETYYSTPIFKNTRLTGDFQFIKNPAFNQDRGPIAVTALRLRTSF